MDLITYSRPQKLRQTDVRGAKRTLLPDRGTDIPTFRFWHHVTCERLETSVGSVSRRASGCIAACIAAKIVVVWNTARAAKGFFRGDGRIRQLPLSQLVHRRLPHKRPGANLDS